VVTGFRDERNTALWPPKCGAAGVSLFVSAGFHALLPQPALAVCGAGAARNRAAGLRLSLRWLQRVAEDARPGPRRLLRGRRAGVRRAGGLEAARHGVLPHRHHHHRGVRRHLPGDARGKDVHRLLRARRDRVRVCCALAAGRRALVRQGPAAQADHAQGSDRRGLRRRLLRHRRPAQGRQLDVQVLRRARGAGPHLRARADDRLLRHGIRPRRRRVLVDDHHDHHRLRRPLRLHRDPAGGPRALRAPRSASYLRSLAPSRPRHPPPPPPVPAPRLTRAPRRTTPPRRSC